MRVDRDQSPPRKIGEGKFCSVSKLSDCRKVRIRKPRCGILKIRIQGKKMSEKLTIDKLKAVFVFWFRHHGFTGVFRPYGRGKPIVELDPNDIQGYWDLWKQQKNEVKNLGIFMWKDQKMGYFLVCVHVETIRDWIMEGDLFPVEKAFFSSRNGRDWSEDL